MRTLNIIALGALLLAAPAFANEPEKGDQPKTTKLDKASLDFIEKAGAANLAEIRLSEVAHKKAFANDVKKVSQKMIDDHTMVNQQLKDLAGKKGLRVSDELTDAAKDKQKDLVKLTGRELDKKYIEIMIDEHEDAISLFEKTAEGAGDADVRQFATRTLPSLRHHLDMVKSVQKTIEAGS